ncbi:MAG: branched-chain amino acid transport system substrate-binding protein [Candidatus Eremiobacteraeota bacterium]|jgi:branched-chain amino acid transport system substrate-binding protein|nr:branched-chain amino acid transport system substrate-binding protein [Candidatus Eremiobacteraeota bacterium]
MISRRSLLAGGAAAAAAASVPRFTLAAGNAATVKIGFIDSYSGVFSDIAALHKIGAELALADMNAKGRVKFEFAYADDNSKPAVAGTEARRLVSQEGADVLFGLTSSANGLAMTALMNQLGTFMLELGPQDSSITGEKAGKLVYRFSPNNRMMLKTLATRVLALGKKWYFIQADYAFGKDAYSELSGILARAGGTEVGHDIVPLGTSDFSSNLTKARNSGADVLVLANSGLDAANACKQFVDFSLGAKMKLAGINLEDFYYKAVPLDRIAGTTFPVAWTPTCSDSARRLAARLKRNIHGPISWRHQFGYVGATALMNRILEARTTDAGKLAAAFENYSFDAAKPSHARFNAWDHQLTQDIFAGSVVSTKTFGRTEFMFDIVGEVAAADADGGPNTPWANAAKSAIASQTVTARPNYTPKTF